VLDDLQARRIAQVAAVAERDGWHLLLQLAALGEHLDRAIFDEQPQRLQTFLEGATEVMRFRYNPPSTDGGAFINQIPQVSTAAPRRHDQVRLRHPPAQQHAHAGLVCWSIGFLMAVHVDDDGPDTVGGAGDQPPEVGLGQHEGSVVAGRLPDPRPEQDAMQERLVAVFEHHAVQAHGPTHDRQPAFLAQFRRPRRCLVQVAHRPRHPPSPPVAEDMAAAHDRTVDEVHGVVVDRLPRLRLAHLGPARRRPRPLSDQPPRALHHLVLTVGPEVGHPCGTREVGVVSGRDVYHLAHEELNGVVPDTGNGLPRLVDEAQAVGVPVLRDEVLVVAGQLVDPR